MSYFVVSLEREFQRELDLTHAGGGTGRRVGLDVGYISVAGAVNALAGTTLIVIEA